MFANSERNRWHNVVFPVPDGEERTKTRKFAGTLIKLKFDMIKQQNLMVTTPRGLKTG